MGFQLSSNQKKISSRKEATQRKYNGERIYLCFVLLAAFASLATSIPQYKGNPGGWIRGNQTCECINPFLGTPNAHRGDSDSLCGSDGPGFCFVDCDADCSDIQPTTSASRCQSSIACKCSL